MSQEIDMGVEGAGLYSLLASMVTDRPKPPSPSTSMTATIETVDNDRSLSIATPGTGFPLLQ